MYTERMLWTDIVKKYPDKWVALTDFTIKNATPFDGVVMAICTEDEMSEYDTQLSKTGKRVLWDRTTNIGGNVLWID